MSELLYHFLYLRLPYGIVSYCLTERHERFSAKQNNYYVVLYIARRWSCTAYKDGNAFLARYQTTTSRLNEQKVCGVRTHAMCKVVCKQICSKRI